MHYDDRAYMGPVTEAEAKRIRRKVRGNMSNFLGHRELPLNENVVREANAKFYDAVLADPERYGEALAESAEFNKRYREKHGESLHINTPPRKLLQIMTREGKL